MLSLLTRAALILEALPRVAVWLGVFALGSMGLNGCKGVWAIADLRPAPVLSQQAVEPLRVSPLTGFDHTIAGETR